jgi:hypothetical protein
VTRYLHPLLGVAVVALLGYVALLGFQLRSAKARSARHGPPKGGPYTVPPTATPTGGPHTAPWHRLAARHARLAPIAYWAVLATWITGAVSTAWLRPDLAFASTLHFRSGCALAALLTASALTARAFQRGNAGAREIHPWLGAAAVLVAAAHVVAGLRITP